MKSKEEEKEKDYSTKLKNKLKSLFPLTKNTQNSLEDLINEKLSTNCENDEDEKIFALKMILYFLKKNNFVSDNYFKLIENDIHKIFYEILENPNKIKTIIEDFQRLNYGADVIFEICYKIANYESKFSCFDLFFNIIIENNFNRLKEMFGKSFDIIKNHSLLIRKLSNFIKIKFDESITYNELIGLFMQKNVTNEEIINDLNLDEFTLNKEKETEMTKQENSFIENKNSEQAINSNKFLEHLKAMKKKYDKLGMETPILNYLITQEAEINIEYFRYEKNPDSIIDHLYENLKKLIVDINLNIINFNEEKYGYLAYYDENKNTIESMYSIVDLDFLFEKIVENQNFPKDDFNNPNDLKAKNAFKSRALSFEYFINKIILFNKCNIKERGRVIYPFKSISEIKNNGNETQNIIIEQKKINSIEEIDGVIFEETNKIIDLEKNCFIIDKSISFGIFNNKEAQFIDSVINNSDEKIDENTIKLKDNCLCLIEIKNQFPIKEKKEGEDLKKQPATFFTVVKNTIKKAKIFMQIYEQDKKKIDHIKILLFYDTIHKMKYLDELTRAIRDSFEISDKLFLDKLIFQFVFIKPSYLAGGLFNTFSLTENLKSVIKKLLKENKSLKEKVQELSDNLKNYQIEETNQKCDNFYKKIQELVAFVSDSKMPEDEKKNFYNIVNSQK